MPPATPTCNFKCEGRDCFLNGPAPPNDGKRMLQDSRKTAGPDVAKATYDPTLAGTEQYNTKYVNKLDNRGLETPKPPPLDIPTRTINTS